MIGTVYASDVYTDTERIQNYIEVFKAYPPQYEGKRDYNMLRRLKHLRDYKIKIDEDGNAVLVTN